MNVVMRYCPPPKSHKISEDEKTRVLSLVTSLKLLHFDLEYSFTCCIQQILPIRITIYSHLIRSENSGSDNYRENRIFLQETQPERQHTNVFIICDESLHDVSERSSILHRSKRYLFPFCNVLHKILRYVIRCFILSLSSIYTVSVKFSFRCSRNVNGLFLTLRRDIFYLLMFIKTFFSNVPSMVFTANFCKSRQLLPLHL